MTMHPIDWMIVFACVAAITWFSVYTARYMKGVADFLAGNRTAGRYVLTMAASATGLGAISAVSYFEQYYAAGFPTIWWMWMTVPAGLVITLTGWVYYRFRETRCLTLAQFFEVRYSRRFRIFAAMIVWLSGLLNFGIFPYVAANFFVYFCGMPDTLPVLGLPTYWPIMVATTGMALLYTTLGGQITVMLTDCIQGFFCGVVLLVLSVFLLNQYPWEDVVESMQTAPTQSTREDLTRDADLKKLAFDEAISQGMADVAQERRLEYESLLAKIEDPDQLREEASGKSMLNPFDTSRVENFGLAFFLILVFNQFYGALSWQGSQAYQSSGISPHEQKMGQIIFPWVYAIRLVGLMLLAVTALTFLNHPNYASQAAEANQVLDDLRQSDVPQLAVQQRVPVALSYMLPTGLRGLFCVSMVFLLITTQDTYMHSWGSIFVQDILLPLLQKRIPPEQHVRWLRWSICGVALFAILFAIFYEPSEFIQMYFAITGAVFSGLGCAIIGGLYWKYGGTLAAYVAVSIGAVLSIARIVLQQYTEQIAAVPAKGPLLRLVDYLNTQVTSQIIWFWIMVICIVVYIFLSLVRLREPFDLDKMLHRGKYDDKGDHQKATNKWRAVWLNVIGITDEFSRFDQLLALALVLWNAIWISIFVVVTATHYFVTPIENAWWNSFWHVWIYVQIGVGIPAMVWFTIGGVRDIRAVFQRLATGERDATDDGTVFKDGS